MRIEVNPKRKLFYWGPIEARPVYVDVWHRALMNCQKLYGAEWPPSLEYFKNEKLLFIAGFKKVYDNGEKIFKKHILAEDKFKRNYKKWEKISKKLLKEINKIKVKNLTELSQVDLKKLVLDFFKIYEQELWFIGQLPEIGNWGGEQLLARELRQRIKDEADYSYVFEKLAAPEKFSFYQREKIDLSSLKKIKNRKLIDKKLAVHQLKYFWILNSHKETKVLPVDFFRKNLSAIPPKAAEKILKSKLKSDSIKIKREIIKKFKLPKKILRIGRRLAFSVWWQDLRKTYILQAYHIIDLFLKEIAGRYKINFNGLHFYSINEIKNLLELGKIVEANEINLRKKDFLIIFSTKGGLKYFSGKKAIKVIGPYLKDEVKKEISQIKGLAVNLGRVRGRVKIIQSSKEVHKIKKGNILVASMTAPNYIIALRRAAAVVTDEGGMTSHAAIVSRELGIPAIVGTKIATKVLHDGQLVEVDANKGVVRLRRKATADK